MVEEIVGKWKNWSDGRCDLDTTPELCPGLLLFSRLVNEPLPKAIMILKTCDCPQAKRLIERPGDYMYGVIAGIACRNRKRGRDCGENADIEYIDDKIPSDTKRNLVNAIRAIMAAGYRIQEVVWDAEIVHVVVNAGCGTFVISCGPVSCSITDAKGVSVTYEGTITARCTRAPPYLGDDYVNYLP